VTLRRARVGAAFVAAWVLATAVAYPALEWYIRHCIRGWFG
jgi:hypothetical protein